MCCVVIVPEGYETYYCSFLPTTISISPVVLSVLLSMFRRSASAGSGTALCAQEELRTYRKVSFKDMYLQHNATGASTQCIDFLG
jgi:hypothetical protein